MYFGACRKDNGSTIYMHIHNGDDQYIKVTVYTQKAITPIPNTSKVHGLKAI